MAAVVLTLLLVVLWLAFVALGYWHGGWRQVVLLAGMLLSYAVLSEWAAPNGHDLATQFHWSVARATTAVGLLYLLGGTVVLGFLGGFVLERPLPLPEWERRLGAAMGVLNGGLLLALTLRTLRSYAYVAGGGEVLRTAALPRFLIESIGYLLLAALVLGVVAVVVGLTVARRPARYPAPVSEPTVAHATLPSPQAARPIAPPTPVAVPVAMGAPPHLPASDPGYGSEPIIDWPTTPPPGTRVELAAVAPMVAASAEPETKPEGKEASQPIPVRPTLPRRVEPPMWYPVAELAASPAPVSLPTPRPAPAVPMPATQPPTPPPGAPDSAPSPPTAAGQTLPPAPIAPARISARVPPPEAKPDRVPSTAREPGGANQEVPPSVEAEDVTARDTPPVVRKVDVATDNLPVVAGVDADRPAGQLPATTAPDTKADAMSGPERDPVPSPPVMPNAITETTPLPAVTPPPLPSLPARQAAAPTEQADAPANSPRSTEQPAQQDEPMKARGGFARVAVARQAGQRPESPPGPQPVPQPPAEPEPLQPPLPTGPRVHACPTCGYPVRDHARYCPNCGSRQRP